MLNRKGRPISRLSVQSRPFSERTELFLEMGTGTLLEFIDNKTCRTLQNMSVKSREERKKKQGEQSN